MAATIIGANGEDQRLTLAIQLWLKNNLVDHFFGNHVVFKKIQMAGKVVKSGFGTQIVVPMKSPAPGGPRAAGVSDPYQAVSHSQMTGITRSKWNVAEYFMPISVPQRELTLQGSETKKLGVLESYMEIGMDRFMDTLRAHMWAAESDANSAGSETQIASLRTLYNGGGSNTTGPYTPAPHPAQLVAAVGTTPQTTVGGINRDAANMAYFCVPIINPVAAATFSKNVINNLISTGTRGKDAPDLLILTQGHFDVLMGILQSQRVITDSKLAEFGFTGAFSWLGCDVVWDDDAPIFNSGTDGYNAMALNTKNLRLEVATMEPSVKKTEDPERPIQAWKADWYGCLLLENMGRAAGARHGNLAA